MAETVALVLAGGGARGAYELGALAELLPALEAQGRRPTVIVGTSVGALNMSYLASTADLPVEEVAERGVSIWSRMRWSDILCGFGSRRAARRLWAYLAEVAGLPVSARALLDPAPLAATVDQVVSFDRLEANVAAGRVTAAAVATSAATGRSVVFHAGGPSPPPDDRRGIDYVHARLRREHILASAAIPVAFPAVRVPEPERHAGWYFDGGTRLNTPIKPALRLGADRVVIVALNALGGPRRLHDGQPDLAEGASQLVHAVLVDPLVADTVTLANANRQVQRVRAAGAEVPGRRVIPYVFVAPETPHAVGTLAASVYNERYASALALLRATDLALIGRLTSGGRDPIHGELLSYLLFAPEFTSALIAMGRADARRWLRTQHDEGIWRTTSAPPGAEREPVASHPTEGSLAWPTPKPTAH